MSPRHRDAGGFTLVELVVSIVLAAIVASLVVLFLDAPIQSYFAQTRRADLVDSANRIAAAVTNDFRTALPNSMRFAPSASSQALEFLATQGVARYYATGDSPGPDLTFGGSPVLGFATLDSFNTPTLPYSAGHLAVGNLRTTPLYDAYSSGNEVMTPASVTITAGANPGENEVTLSAAMTFQTPAPPAVHNAYLVSGPVSYVCTPNPANPSAGTFIRYSGYAITTAQLVPPAPNGALIAHNVSACTLSFQPAPAGYPYGQLAIFRLTLSSGGEALQVFVQAPTEYSQ